MLIKIGLSLFIIGFPAILLMRWFGSSFPRIYNGFDWIGVCGFFLMLAGLPCLIVGGLMKLWGI